MRPSLAGPDFLMRSIHGCFSRDPEKYRQKVIDAGTPPDIPDIAIRQGGTTLVQPVAIEAHREAQKGASGSRSRPTTSVMKPSRAYAPTGKIANLRWSMVAKIDTRRPSPVKRPSPASSSLATTGIIFLVCLRVILAQVFLHDRSDAWSQAFSASVPATTRSTFRFGPVMRSAT